MALSSSSTDTEVIAAFEDNADWIGNSTKARARLEAINIMVYRFPQAQAVNGRSFNREALLDEKKRLEEYVKATSSSGNRVSFVKARIVY